MDTNSWLPPTGGMRVVAMIAYAVAAVLILVFVAGFIAGAVSG